VTPSLLSRAALPLVAVVAALLGAGATWLVNRGAAGDEIRTYLLKHPEVIPEAIEELQRRDAARAIAASRSDIVTPVGSAWSGNPAGDVTVVEYLDYNCGYCRASVATLDQLIAADPKVKVVYREWPILGDESVLAARYATAVAKMGGNYRKLHDALYAGGPLSEKSIDDAIRAAGADPAAVKKASALPDVDPTIMTNMQVMKSLNQTGTPSWVIGDKAYSGVQTLEQLQAAVAEARKAKTTS